MLFFSQSYLSVKCLTSGDSIKHGYWFGHTTVRHQYHGVSANLNRLWRHSCRGWNGGSRVCNTGVP